MKKIKFGSPKAKALDSNAISKAKLCITMSVGAWEPNNAENLPSLFETVGIYVIKKDYKLKKFLLSEFDRFTQVATPKFFWAAGDCLPKWDSDFCESVLE
jgi:hypothetical protein